MNESAAQENGVPFLVELRNLPRFNVGGSAKDEDDDVIRAVLPQVLPGGVRILSSRELPLLDLADQVTDVRLVLREDVRNILKGEVISS